MSEQQENNIYVNILTRFRDEANVRKKLEEITRLSTGRSNALKTINENKLVKASISDQIKETQKLIDLEQKRVRSVKSAGKTADLTKVRELTSSMEKLKLLQERTQNVSKQLHMSNVVGFQQEVYANKAYTQKYINNKVLEQESVRKSIVLLRQLRLEEARRTERNRTITEVPETSSISRLRRPPDVTRMSYTGLNLSPANTQAVTDVRERFKQLNQEMAQSKQRARDTAASFTRIAEAMKTVGYTQNLIKKGSSAVFDQAIANAKNYGITLKESLTFLKRWRQQEINTFHDLQKKGKESTFDRTTLDVLGPAITKLENHMKGSSSRIAGYFANIFGGTKWGARIVRASHGIEDLSEGMVGLGQMSATSGAKLTGLATKIGIAFGLAMVVVIPLIKAVQKLVQVTVQWAKEFTKTGIELSKSIEVIKLGVTGMVGSAEGATAFVNDMRNMAAAMGTTAEETINTGRRLMPFARGSQDALRNMIVLAQQLALSNPKAGLDSATLAVIEAMNGEMTSMRRTFNMNTDAIRVWHQEFQRTGDLDAYIAKIQEYMATIGYSTELVEQYGNTFEGTMKRTKLMYENFAMAFADPIMNTLTEGLKSFNEYLEEHKYEITEAFVRIGATIAVILEDLTASTDQIILFNDILVALRDETFSGGLQDAIRDYQDYMQYVRMNNGDFSTRVEEKVTHTMENVNPDGTYNIPSDYNVSLQAQQEAITNAATEVADAMDDYYKSLEDAAVDHEERMTDIVEDAIKERSDALKDYNKDVEDVEEDYQENLEDKKKDYNEKIEEIEQDHVDKLLEIRQKYLDQLFDAVNARDARRVYEIMRDMNKELADENKGAQDKRKEAQDDYQKELEDLREARDKRLEELKESYAEELADIAEKEAEALAEEQKSYAKRLKELEDNLTERLAEMAKMWARAGVIDGTGAAQIQQIAIGLYGEHGSLLTLYYAFTKAQEAEATRHAIAMATLNNTITPGVTPGGIPIPQGGIGAVPGVPLEMQQPTTAQTQQIASKLYMLNQALGSFYAVETANAVLHQGNTSKLKSYNLGTSLFNAVDSFVKQQNYMQAYSVLSSGLSSLIASNLGSQTGGGVTPMATGLDIVATRPVMFQAGEVPERIISIPLNSNNSVLSNGAGGNMTIVHKVDGNGISKEFEALIAYQIGRATGQAVSGYSRSRRK